MSVLNVLAFLAKIGSAIMQWLHDKGIKDAQRTKDERDQSVGALQEVDKASRARDAAAAADRDPGSLRRPDGDSAPRGEGGIS